MMVMMKEKATTSWHVAGARAQVEGARGAKQENAAQDATAQHVVV
jgi:hypothetical protein